MRGIMHKIFAKSVSIRINPFLRQHVHASQYGFVGGRPIHYNILAMELGIEYAQATK